MLFSCNYRVESRKVAINYDSYIDKVVGNWHIKSYQYLKKRFHFHCICKCGNESTIQASSLLSGESKSCNSCAPKKHGYYKTPTNSAWSGARNRCNNPNNKDYVHYGARGIRFSEKWNNFEDFLKDMGEKPIGLTLDRIDNNGNYEPGNCRWATYSQQNRNQRKRSLKITLGGQ